MAYTVLTFAFGSLLTAAKMTQMYDNNIELADNLIGSVIWNADNVVLTRTLECDGAAISRTTFVDLFDVIDTLWGVGDGSTTFNIPDLRGEFVRGWDNGKGTDSGRSFASSQGEAVGVHAHTSGSLVATVGLTGGGAPLHPTRSVHQSTTTTPVTGSTANAGSETRPRNYALMPLIVFASEP